MMRLAFEGQLAAQAWESYRDSVPARYARHGGLERWVQDETAWRRIEAEQAERLRKVGRLDRARRRVGEMVGPDASFVTIQIVGALVISLWDQARRDSGELDMVMAVQRRRGGAVFATLEEALAFVAYGVPAEDDASAPAPIGMVSRGWVREGEPGGARSGMRLMLAQDRDEDVRERRRVEAKGQEMPAGPRRAKRESAPTGPLPAGGFLPVSFVPARGSRSGGARAAGLSVVELMADLWGGIEAAGMASEIGWAEWSDTSLELEALVSVHVGRWMPVPRRRRFGDAGDRRGRGQTELVQSTVQDIAREQGMEERAARDWLRRARRALRMAWVLRGLIPPRDDAEKDARKKERDRMAALLNMRRTG